MRDFDGNMGSRDSSSQTKNQIRRSITTRLKRDLKHARETVSAGRRGSRPRPSNPPGRPRTSPMGVWHVAKSRMLAPQDAVKGRPVVPLFAF